MDVDLRLSAGVCNGEACWLVGEKNDAASTLADKST